MDLTSAFPQPLPEPDDTSEQDSTTVLSIETDDNGDAVITLGPSTAANDDQPAGEADFYANLAEDAAVGTLAYDILEGVEADQRSRAEWEANYNKGLDLLGLKIEESQDGRSTVRDPLLQAAIIKFQAQALGELLPASGPVKVRNDGPPLGGEDTRADDLERDLNHYLTVTATEYYPDTDRGLFYLAFGGNLFKKVYFCPVRRRPVSECVYVTDLIVSNDATDLANAQRVTHRIEMDRARMEGLQASGVYLDETLMTPINTPTSVEQKEAQVSGISASVQRPEDIPYVVYECYTRLSPSKYGLGDEDELLPFKVSVERDSRRVLEVRRNWKEDDDLKRPKQTFVHYGLIPAFGFLCLGFLHIVGNQTRQMTAIDRILIDAGMYANFPGGVMAKSRHESNEIRPAPGQFVEIDTGNLSIKDAIMALPYAGPNAELMQLRNTMKDEADALAGTVSIETGDGQTNVPVGTIMAQIEQQTQVLIAVHKRLHKAQQQEFILLKALFAEDPEAIWRGNENPKRRWSSEEEFGDLDLVPASDPNVPAHVHRLMQATALEMLSSNHPELYNVYEIQRRILRILNVGDINEVLPPPEAPPDAPDPNGALADVAKMQVQIDAMRAKLDEQKAILTAQNDARQAQLKAKDMQLRAAEMMQKAQGADRDRQSKERIAAMSNQTAILVEAMKEGAAQFGEQYPSSGDPAGDEVYGP